MIRMPGRFAPYHMGWEIRLSMVHQATGSHFTLFPHEYLHPPVYYALRSATLRELEIDRGTHSVVRLKEHPRRSDWEQHRGVRHRGTRACRAAERATSTSRTRWYQYSQIAGRTRIVGRRTPDGARDTDPVKAKYPASKLYLCGRSVPTRGLPQRHDDGIWTCTHGHECRRIMP